MHTNISVTVDSMLIAEETPTSPILVCVEIQMSSRLSLLHHVTVMTYVTSFYYRSPLYATYVLPIDGLWAIYVIDGP